MRRFAGVLITVLMWAATLYCLAVLIDVFLIDDTPARFGEATLEQPDTIAHGPWLPYYGWAWTRDTVAPEPQTDLPSVEASETLPDLSRGNRDE